ncbi:MAG: hypothetical protein LBM02_08830 [Lachnospiraceae bacterium]|nr:hypothetical protein [Lachnospiraceae bacterium]
MNLNKPIHTFANEPSVNQLIKSNDYYSIYYRKVTNGGYVGTASDTEFNETEIKTIMGISSSGDIANEILSNYKNFSEELKDKIIKRSGLLIRKDGYRINSYNIDLTYLSGDIKEIGDKTIISTSYEISTSILDIPINVYTLINNPVSTPISGNQEGKDESVTEENKDTDIEQSHDEKVIIDEETRNIYTLVEPSTSIANANKKPTSSKANPQLNVTSVLKVVTIYKNLGKEMAFSPDKANANITLPKLTFSFIITHSYYVTGGVGSIILILVGIVLVSDFFVYLWYRKKKMEMIDKI